MARIALVVACVVLCALLCQNVRALKLEAFVPADGSFKPLNSSASKSPALNSSALKTARARAYQFLTFILEASGRPVERQAGVFPNDKRPNYRPAAQGAATAYLVTGEKSLFHGTPITWPNESEVRHGSFWALDKGYAGIGVVDKKLKVSKSGRMLTYNAPDPPLESGFVLIQNRDGFPGESGDLALSPALKALSKQKKGSLEPAEVPRGSSPNVVAAWRFCNYVKPENNHRPPENWAGLINYLPYAQTYGFMENLWFDYNKMRHYNCPSPLPKRPLNEVSCKDRKNRDVPNGFYAFFSSALEAIKPGAANNRPGRIGEKEWQQFLDEGHTWIDVDIQQMMKVDEYEVVACKTPGELQEEESIHDLLEVVKWKTIEGHSKCKDNPYRTMTAANLDVCKQTCFEAFPRCSVIGFKDGTCMLYSKCDTYWFWYRGTGYRLEELLIPSVRTLVEWMNKDLYENEVAWPRFSIDFLSWAPTVKMKLITAKADLKEENTNTLATFFKNESNLKAFIALLGSPQATRQAEKSRIHKLRDKAGQLMNTLKERADETAV